MALARHMLRTGVALALFTVAGTAIVAYTFDQTRTRIAESERAALLQKLHALLPPGQHDNDLLGDTLEVTAPELGPKAVKVHRARKGGMPVAAAFTPVIAPDGYSGPIKLLIAIHYDGTLAGVRVIGHRETPGLGDPIEETRSDWILEFTGRSLSNPEPPQWKVKKDGGAFDQFTGATITPRAVVKAVYNSLSYFAAHRDEVFAPATAAAPGR
ncbi:MAG: electron transport complex subunit RsxG [Gammaproteobacteria bacterium]|nr:electron transport complex subunit RsxG [Gammaproteobacteria bacterium]